MFMPICMCARMYIGEVFGCVCSMCAIFIQGVHKKCIHIRICLRSVYMCMCMSACMHNLPEADALMHPLLAL